MKALRFSLSLYLFCFIALLSCCKDDPSTIEDPNKAKLVRLWNASEVRLDGQDITHPGFTDFNIEFKANGNYLVNNGLPVFTSSEDTWTFKKNSESVIILNGIQASIAFFDNDNVLHLTFTLPNAPIGGRTKGLNNDYQFILNAQ